MHNPDRCLKRLLGAVIFGGLALMLWPLWVAVHRNERVRLERWQP